MVFRAIWGIIALTTDLIARGVTVARAIIPTLPSKACDYLY